MRVLASVSAIQLLIHLVQAHKAVREGIHFDLPFGHGKPENVARDMWTIGSGLAAPWPILAAHTVGTMFLLGKRRVWLTQAVGWLGVLYVFGYLAERSVRKSFRRPNAETTALNVSATALSIVMAWLGLTARREQRTNRGGASVTNWHG